jgi:hypothetical protein
MSRKPHFETETAEEDLGGAAPRNMNNHERRLTLFIDFETSRSSQRQIQKFEVSLLLERLLKKGKIVAKRAYCDRTNTRPETRLHGRYRAIKIRPLVLR